MILNEIYNNQVYQNISSKRSEILEFYKILENFLLEANDSYYNKSHSIIEDREYDELLKRYEELCIQYNLNNNIAVGAKSNFNKIAHLNPMLSLSNSYSMNDIQIFLNRFQDIREYCCELKIDGVSFNLIYKEGQLIDALTRGDGQYGESILRNLPPDIPLQIPYKEDIEMRGEIFLNLSEFKRLNIDNQFVNPRNTISGAIRKKHSNNINANYIIYNTPKKITNTQYENLQKFQEYKFKINNHTRICNTIHEIQEYYEEMMQIRRELDYEIDGIVIKINDLNYAYSLDLNAKYVKHSIAYKFPATCAQTQILDIRYQVGRTGILTPVARLKPVYVGGVTIKNVTLHNINYIIKHDIHINDYIRLERAGDVIPKVKEVLSHLRPLDSIKYIIPTRCPSCNTNINLDYKCTNKINCPAQEFEYIKYVIKELNIKSLGEKIIEQLMKKNIINNIIDIFTLTRESLLKLDNLGEISAYKLLTMINKSKYISLDTFIHILGIEEVGKSTAQIISKKLKSIYNLLSYDYIDFSQEDNIGKNIHHNIHTFFTNNKDLIQKLSECFIIENKKEYKCPDELLFLQNKKIAISGSFKQGKKYIINQLSQYNIDIKNHLSKDFDYLILGEKAGQKEDLAKKYKINIINEKFLLKILK